MEKKILPQEALKLLACATMLIDHVGAVFFPDLLLLRIIGRLAFPLYCFLLVEGAFYTRNPKKYALRLLIGLLLSEVPYNLALFGQLSWNHQNVLFTLLIGFGMLQLLPRFSGAKKVLVILLCSIAAELIQSDYGAMGIWMIALFALTRDLEEDRLLQGAGLVLLSFWNFPSNILQAFAAFAVVPISRYSGKKVTATPLFQWGFYLFYPVHLGILWWISQV